MEDCGNRLINLLGQLLLKECLFSHSLIARTASSTGFPGTLDVSQEVTGSSAKHNDKKIAYSKYITTDSKLQGFHQEFLEK